MATIENIVNDLKDAINSAGAKKTSAYDTQATVRRIEGDTAWVHIPGGVDETPVKLTIAAHEGDNVQVRVSGGRAFLVGNGSAPPTDDATAVVARTIAVEAKDTADNVMGEAERARAAADSAEAAAAEAKETTDEINAYAQTAGKTVTQILNDGETAGAAAQSAVEAANSALINLATVEDVVNVLNWIATHCKYEKTTDPAVVSGKVYYTVTATTVSSPSNDDISTYYELVSGSYVKTTDTAVVSGKTYYTVVGTPVLDPQTADIGTYYELDKTDAVSTYINNHLVLTTEGLWLLPGGSDGNKVLIAVGGSGHTYSTAGTYIIGKVNNVDTVLASFTASGAVIGQNASGKTRSELSTSGMQIIQNVSGSDVQIVNLGYGSGVDSGGGTSDAPYYTFGTRIKSISSIYDYDPTSTYSVGDRCMYDGALYICKNDITTPEQWTSNHWKTSIGNYSVMAGSGISGGYMSFAEGQATQATGDCSHAEGSSTKAIGVSSHTEGINTKAWSYAHAEGANSEATGVEAHAEGAGSVASGRASHAQNQYTKASSDYQTALGKYNVEDNADTYACIIGNGTADNARSNALTVDWSGNVDIASGAKYKINGTNLSASDVGALAEDANGDISITRNITAGGSITVSGHSSAIGTVISKSQSTTTITSSNGTRTEVANVSLPPGVWVVSAAGQFAANTTGRRWFGLAVGSVSANTTDCVQTPPTSGGVTRLGITGVFNNTGSTNITVYLVMAQYSGGNLGISSGIINAVRIA